MASGRPLSSSLIQPPPSCASGDPQPLKHQKVNLAQKSEIQKCSNSLGTLGGPSGSAVNSQTASLLLDVNQSNAEKNSKKKAMVNNSFRDKLWNWEVLSQKSEMASAFLPTSCRSRASHLEEQKSMAFMLEEPRKKLEIKGTQTLPSQRCLMAQRRFCATSEEPTIRLSQHGRKSGDIPSPERSPTENTCHPTYDNELNIQAPGEKWKPHRPGGGVTVFLMRAGWLGMVAYVTYGHICSQLQHRCSRPTCSFGILGFG